MKTVSLTIQQLEKLNELVAAELEALDGLDDAEKAIALLEDLQSVLE